MKNLKKKKHSSFPEQQLLVENFRGFIERSQLEEEIDRIIGQTESRLLSEGKLEEGLMQQVFKIGKKLGLDKLALIAAITYGAHSPVAKNFVEDLEAQVGDKYSDVQQAASEMASSLKSKGIKLTKSPEGDPVFDRGETTPAEDSDEILSQLKKAWPGADDLQKVGDNIYKSKRQGFVFGTKVDSMRMGYEEQSAVKDKLLKMAEKHGAKIGSHQSPTLTQLDDGVYVTIAQRGNQGT